MPQLVEAGMRIWHWIILCPRASCLPRKLGWFESSGWVGWTQSVSTPPPPPPNQCKAPSPHHPPPPAGGGGVLKHVYNLHPDPTRTASSIEPRPLQSPRIIAPYATTGLSSLGACPPGLRRPEGGAPGVPGQRPSDGLRRGMRREPTPGMRQGWGGG